MAQFYGRDQKIYEGVIRFVGTPKEIFETDDPVVRDFIRGSLPSETYRFREQVPVPSSVKEMPGGTI